MFIQNEALSGKYIPPLFLTKLQITEQRNFINDMEYFQVYNKSSQLNIFYCSKTITIIICYQTNNWKYQIIIQYWIRMGLNFI